jgi:hypothetical protein
MGGEIPVRSRQFEEDFIFADINLALASNNAWKIGRSLWSFREFGRRGGGEVRSVAMDAAKCQALKHQLAGQPEPQIVPIAQFLDGNDDLGSIGCNLDPHPGIDTFRHVLTGLLGRPDVQAVYAQISELDPGPESWPFTDTVLVAGKISVDDLRGAVRSLEPDEVGSSKEFGISPAIATRHGSPVWVVWWD